MHIQGVGVDTFGNLSQDVLPTLYDVPIQFGSINQAFMEVKQVEWHYQNGNEKQDLKFEDCVPWKDKTRIASDCSRICLPINIQYLYEDSVNRPKCQNGSDHICMMKPFLNMVKSILTPKNRFNAIIIDYTLCSSPGISLKICDPMPSTKAKYWFPIKDSIG